MGTKQSQAGSWEHAPQSRTGVTIGKPHLEDGIDQHSDRRSGRASACHRVTCSTRSARVPLCLLRATYHAILLQKSCSLFSAVEVLGCREKVSGDTRDSSRILSSVLSIRRSRSANDEDADTKDSVVQKTRLFQKLAKGLMDRRKSGGGVFG